MRGAQRFQAEVIDDQQLDARECLEAALIVAGGARGVQLAEQIRLRGEDDFVACAHRTVAARLREMTFARAAGSCDEHVGVLGDEAASGQVLDHRPVQFRDETEVELLDGLVRAESGAAHAQVELLLLAPGDLVGDEQRQEFAVGELGGNRLLVSCLQRVEDAREAQLFEQR